MHLQELKQALKGIEQVNFRLPNGEYVPAHFHLTELGKISKHFIDCGGTERKEESASLQLWYAEDYDHRLSSDKFVNIIEMAEKALNINNPPVEIEYQSDTIAKYGLGFDGKDFILLKKQTTCLAMDKCGIPVEKEKLSLSSLKPKAQNNCTPGGGCC